MASKQDLMRKWRELPPKKRGLIALGGGAVLVIAAGILFGEPEVAPGQQAKTNSASNFSLPVNKDISMEQLAAQVASIRSGQDEDRLARARLEKILMAKEEAKGNQDPLTADVLKELRELRTDVDTIKTQKAASQEPDIALDDQLPTDGAMPTPNGSPQPPQPSVVEPPQIRITGGQVKESSVKEDDSAEKKKESAYLPAGSNFEGVLLNGMDAPTSGAAKQNPVPALVRLDTDAILPSRHRYDVRECFTIVSGFGVMSTERAQLQTVTISCVKTDGTVIESKLDGYVVGEDGKVGLRGRLVTKQGQLLAKSFATGVFAGIGQALAPMAVPQLNVAPGGTAQYQAPNMSQVATSATAQGLQNTAKSISAFYLDMAKEMFPVIEIDAMRRVTIVLVKGVELNMVGGTK